MSSCLLFRRRISHCVRQIVIVIVHRSQSLILAELARSLWPDMIRCQDGKERRPSIEQVSQSVNINHIPGQRHRGVNCNAIAITMDPLSGTLAST